MREKCNRLAFVPAVYLLAVLCAWSWWSHETTGKRTHVAKISSFGGINLYKGNNEFVEALYAEVHMNALDYAGLTDIQDKEWTVNGLSSTGSAISVIGLVARVTLPMV